MEKSSLIGHSVFQIGADLIIFFSEKKLANDSASCEID